jgi:hypothetical protein
VVKKVEKAERAAKVIKDYFDQVDKLFDELKRDLAKIEAEERDLKDLDMGYDFVLPDDN